MIERDSVYGKYINNNVYLIRIGSLSPNDGFGESYFFEHKYRRNIIDKWEQNIGKISIIEINRDYFYVGIERPENDRIKEDLKVNEINSRLLRIEDE